MRSARTEVEAAAHVRGPSGAARGARRSSGAERSADRDGPPVASREDQLPRPAGGSALVSRRARLRGTVYLLLDTSASMADGDKMVQLVRGSVRFFYEAWRRRYAVGAVAFARRAWVAVGATRDPHRFERGLRGLEPDGGTAMDAALRLACWRLRFRRGRRVMILITDGKPDDRAATLDAARRARALGVTVLAVGTEPADQAFLWALVPHPAFADRVGNADLADGIDRVAGRLPGAGAADVEEVP